MSEASPQAAPIENVIPASAPLDEQQNGEVAGQVNSQTNTQLDQPDMEV